MPRGPFMVLIVRFLFKSMILSKPYKGRVILRSPPPLPFPCPILILTPGLIEPWDFQDLKVMNQSL